VVDYEFISHGQSLDEEVMRSHHGDDMETISPFANA
jgi:hypothetical protein